MNNISDEKLKQEKEILHNIYACIRDKKSFVFNAGAGSGKTYSLIKALRYSIDIYGDLFNKYNQKIMCITYTNVAKDEVKNRLGKTNIVEVSTIHQKLWEIIKDYQSELLDIHKEKLKNCIEKLNPEIENFVKSTMFEKKSFDNTDFANFVETCKEKENIIYENYNKNAKNFREIIGNFFDDFDNVLKNVSEFKKTVNNLRNKRNYENALDELNKDDNKNIYLEYDARIPQDRLEKFKISHNTLIEYTKEIILRARVKNDLIKRIIIDKYPIIFIDEYQDTLDDVEIILKELKKYSLEIKRNFIVGYFGDSAQNIYEKGIGEITANETCIGIKNNFNRRSRTQIINVCNKIRNDTLEQETIYSNFDDGNVELYFNDGKTFEEVLEDYKIKYNISKENPVHCLILKNEMIAEKSGFKEVFEFFKNSRYYKENYNKLGEELLSNDKDKLGSIPKMLYEILKLKNEMKNENALLKDFYNSSKLKQVNKLKLEELVKLNNVISNIEIKNLQEYLDLLFLHKTNSKSILFEYAVNNLLENILGIKDINDLKNQIIISLKLEENDKNNSDYINKLFEIDIAILDNWYNYISRNYTKDEIYHTIHSTKGLEFDNVLVLLQDNFASKQNYFKEYFINIEQKNLDENFEKTLQNRRNLLYVACSRTKKNLTVFYDDTYVTEEEYDIIKTNLNKIFKS